MPLAKIADGQNQEVDYQKPYGKNFNTSEELADFIWQLSTSNALVGIVNDAMRLDLLSEKTPHF
ncbi:hypothetical protein ACYSNU_15245 [Enterococcus sp. LJL120]